MSELGIFIDESGVIDFKNSNTYLNDLYIVSFLFHDKSHNIDKEVVIFENFLLENNLQKDFPIHSMPLIRSQKPYDSIERNRRQKIFYRLFQFMRKLELKHSSFICKKRNCSSKQSLRINIENHIENMITNNLEYFKKFDEIVIYYDEGQDYLSKILHNAFSKNLNNYRFKEDICQNEYRLLQCADMVCSLELINQRKQNNEYIKAIEMFFISNNKYNKNYAKSFKKLEL